MTWRIEPHIVATAHTPGPEVFFQRAFGEWIDIAIYVFVLRSADATVLVDTGLLADPEPLNAAMRTRKGPQAGFVPHARLPEILQGRPDAAILTSFGPYAAGGLTDLPAGVPLHVSRRGLADLASPEEPALHHALAGPLAARLVTATPVAGEAPVLDGITFIETAVHHPHSAAVLVETAEGCIAIADPIFHRRNVEEGLALGVAEDVPGWYALARDLAARCDALLPIHDPDPSPVPVARWHPLLTRRPPC